MTEDRITANEYMEMMREAAKTLRVGDRIELRSHKPFSIDDDGMPPSPPEYLWEPVEIVDILPPAPSGDVVVLVRHADGTEFVQSLARPWRPLAS
jgi:hypothetical protein